MAQVRITKRFIDGIAATGEEQTFFDTELAGFYIRVSKSGDAKSYGIKYLNKAGQQRRLKIGVHGVLTPDQARTTAVQFLAMVARGVDPAAKHKAYREAWTVADLAAFFRKEIIPEKRKQTATAYGSQIDRFIVPKLGRLKLSEATTADVVRFHRQISEHGKPQANRVVRCLSSMFSTAIREGHMTSNPCHGVKLHPENQRERFLSEEELGRLLIACDEHHNQQAANLVRLLAFTGARKTEAMAARWEMFDLERGLWTMPSHHTKQKRVNTVSLSATAVALLNDMRAETDESDPGNPWLFPGRDPDRPLVEIKTPWGQIVDAGKLTGVTLHVLRHTFASHAVLAGESLHKTGKLLGHTRATTTHRYAHLEADSLRDTASVIDRVAKAGKAKAMDRREAEARKVVNIASAKRGR